MYIEDIKNHACTKTGCLCENANYYPYPDTNNYRKFPMWDGKIFIGDLSCIHGQDPRARVCRFYQWNGGK